MIIREIQPQDNEQIANVIRQVFISDDYPKTGTAFADSQLDFMFETYDKIKSIYFVIEIDGKIVGGAGVSQLDNSEENICELQKMYFLQETRGKGIGYEMIQKCLAKAKELDAAGVKALVVNHSHVNHIDVETLKASLAKTKGKLITIEDHQVLNGMGSMIVHALKMNNVDFKVKSLGIGGEFGQSAYKADQLYARFDLSASGIVKAYHSLS